MSFNQIIIILGNTIIIPASFTLFHIHSYKPKSWITFLFAVYAITAILLFSVMNYTFFKNNLPIKGTQLRILSEFPNLLYCIIEFITFSCFFYILINNKKINHPFHLLLFINIAALIFLFIQILFFQKKKLSG